MDKVEPCPKGNGIKIRGLFGRVRVVLVTLSLRLGFEPALSLDGRVTRQVCRGSVDEPGQACQMPSHSKFCLGSGNTRDRCHAGHVPAFLYLLVVVADADSECDFHEGGLFSPAGFCRSEFRLGWPIENWETRDHSVPPM
jgi:hypothetical protein